MINLKLDSSHKTVEVFRKIVASPFFVTQPIVKGIELY